MKTQSENTLKGLATALFLVSFTANLGAQGSEFTYNGLLNENGNPLNGLVELEATLWDAATNGNQIISVHPLRQMVEVRKGLFTVVLDFGKEAFSGPPRWLQIALRKDPDPAPFTTLWPRQKITAVPYAVTAEEISGKVPIGGLFGAYSNVVAFDNPGNSFAGRGFDLTDLNASQLISGTVPSAALGNAWQIGGNAGTTPGTYFLGTTDNQPLELKVNGQRALRLEPNPDSPNVIGGFNGNLVWAGDFGSTIGGGGSLNNPNAIYASYATIAGGRNNYISASDYSAIGGGLRNWIRATSFAATIAGGRGNDIGTNSYDSAIGGGSDNNIAANAQYATIPGGDRNFATNRAFAAGTRAKANHTGAFVWADSQDADFASTASNQFLLRAGGGVGINLTNPVHMLHVGTSLGTSAINVSTHRAVVENSAEDGRAALLVLAGPGSSTATNRVELELEANEAQRRAIIGTASNHEIQFRQNNLVRMLLATDGNLYVAGTINGTLASDAVASTQIVDGSVSAADVNAPTFSTTFWKSDGNAGTTPGTHFLGTTDNQPLEMRVNNSRIARFGPGENIALGGPNNRIVGAADSSTIVGGDFNTNSSNFSVVGGGFENSIESLAQQSFIGGGWRNVVHTTSDQSAIVGGNSNKIQSDARESFIGGGFANSVGALGSFIGGGFHNTNTGAVSVIGGGESNSIARNSFYATIAGGTLNRIGTNSGTSVIGGGQGNNITANAQYATIPGGRDNAATNYAFAAGRRAKANHTGAFVWADSTDADFASSGTNQFLIRAGGGVGMNVAQPLGELHVGISSGVAPLSLAAQTIIIDNANQNGRAAFLALAGPGGTSSSNRVELELEANESQRLGIIGTSSNHEVQFRQNNITRMRFATNGNIGINLSNPSEQLHVNGNILATGTITPNSDRHAKTDVKAVDTAAILERVAKLPIQQWRFKAEPEQVKHVGPMAQDFRAAFGLGAHETAIATVDADGVALGAIQGLNQKLEEQLQARDSEIRELRQGLAELKETLKNLTTKTQE